MPAVARGGHCWLCPPQVQRLAARCIHKNLQLFQAVRHWPWWQLLSRVRPLLSVSLAEQQLRAKEVRTTQRDRMEREGMGQDGCDETGSGGML